MGFFIPLFTVILVLDCIVLVFLVLIQLPKKDAGVGLAFGGSASDALFGAGSGTVLTKITKYSAAIFFVLALMLAVMQKNYHNRGASRLESSLSQPAPTPAAPAPSTPAPSPAEPVTSLPAAVTLSNLSSTPVEATNLPPTPTTNAAPAPK